MNSHVRAVLLTLGAILVVWMALLIAKVEPGSAVMGIIHGSVGSAAGWRETFKEMTPLLLAGLGVFAALRAGLFNIGAEGQILVGSLAAAAVALHIPGIPGIVLSMLAATVCGAAWALPAVLIKVYRGGHEVISTIMLNSIASLACAALVKGPLKDASQQSATTALIVPSTFLPNIVSVGSFRINLAWLIATFGVAAFAMWRRRFVLGREWETVGQSPKVAEAAGINVPRVQIMAMSLSGAVAGLAGALLVLGHEHRFYAAFSSGYGFDALGVAFLAGGSAYALFGGAFAFAVINRGVSSLTGLSRGMTGIIVGLLILIFAAWRSRRKAALELGHE